MIRKFVPTLSIAAALCIGTGALAQRPGETQCGYAKRLDAEVAQMHQTYNTLTANKDAGKKHQLKMQIVTTTNELNKAKTSCNQCTAGVSAQNAKVADMHKLYNTYTANKDAGKKQQLKAEIIAETNTLNGLKKACN